MNYLRHFAAGLAALIIHCTAVAADSAASGILLYREPPTTYIELIRYTILREKPVISDVVLPSGGTRQVSNAAIVARLEHPPTNLFLITQAKADETLASIQKLIAAYPQYRAQLNEVATKWQNAISTIKAGASDAARRSLTTAASKSALPSLEVNGTSYVRPVLTGFEGSSVSISHDSGVAQIPLERLTPTQISALNTTSTSVRIAAKPTASGSSGKSRNQNGKESPAISSPIEQMPGTAQHLPENNDLEELPVPEGWEKPFNFDLLLERAVNFGLVPVGAERWPRGKQLATYERMRSVLQSARALQPSKETEKALRNLLDTFADIETVGLPTLKKLLIKAEATCHTVAQRPADFCESTGKSYKLFRSKDFGPESSFRMALDTAIEAKVVQDLRKSGR